MSKKKKKHNELSGHDAERFRAFQQAAAQQRYQLTAKPNQFVLFSGNSAIASIDRLDGRSTIEHLNDLASLLRALL